MSVSCSGSIRKCEAVMRCKLLALLAMVLFWAADNVPATQPDVYRAKVDYLVNFAEFVEWPPSAFENAGSAFIIGVMGKDPFGEELNHIKGQKVNGRTVTIKRFRGALEFRGEE